jgi:osmotically-inducible protein OsmY
MQVSSSILALALAAFGTAAMADNETPASAQPDNSATNKVVIDNGQPTADDASNAKTDVELAASVRKAIVKDKSLSTKAHNVKIIAKNGQVTVSGPVKDEAERQAVTKIATDLVGPANVNADGVVAKK